MVLGKIRFQKMNKSKQPLKCEADKSRLHMEYREDVRGLVKHFHHQPNISGASSVNTIVKVCSNVAQLQKHLYFFMREKRVLMHLCKLLKKTKFNPEIFASFLTEKAQNQLTEQGEHTPEHQPFHFLQSAYKARLLMCSCSAPKRK